MKISKKDFERLVIPRINQGVTFSSIAKEYGVTPWSIQKRYGAPHPFSGASDFLIWEKFPDYQNTCSRIANKYHNKARGGAQSLYDSLSDACLTLNKNTQNYLLDSLEKGHGEAALTKVLKDKIFQVFDKRKTESLLNFNEKGAAWVC